ncbi:nucleoside-diphosphate kinase [Candidatus Saccharibacteria bacterium]|nr:MAG: nucleoside-diphosphate kinase [Candidatus Saccharibacteria bacterium]PID98884.1 MAG: nucleoside-diphosphate kinase [Candidatus Saccharibacteria bacterium]
MEQTLVVFKPDAVMRGIVGEILTRFERAGFKVIAMKMVNPDYEHLHGHYEDIGALKTRKGKEIFESQLAAMQVGPVIAMVLEGVEAVDFVRKMVGDTQPKTAAPGTIRGDYAHVNYGQPASVGMGVANLVHASATLEEAEKEISHWFSDSELFDYETVHSVFTQPKKDAK